MNKDKMLFIVNIPSPYRVDFFNSLSDYYDLTVCFEGARANDRNPNWANKGVIKYNQIILKGLRISADSFISPGVINLLKLTWDYIILGGYSTPTLIIASEYLRAKKKKYWLEIDGGFTSDESIIKYYLKKHLIQGADAWLSTGSVSTDYLVYYGANKDKCFSYPFSSVKDSDILSLGTEFVDNSDNSKRIIYENYREDIRNIAKNKLGISYKYVLLAVGQFIPRKGFDILIKASSNLSDNIGIYIVGGEPTNQYKQLLQEFHVNNVHFIGFKTKQELSDYYKAANIFVHPTREDIWGLVVNEALSYGLPVITTNKCIAGLEMIEKGVNGLIISPNSTEELTNAINEIKNNKYYGYDSIVKAKDYTIETMVKSHVNILTMNK